MIAWRRSGDESVDIEMPAGVHMEQVFPAPAERSHAPHAGEWKVEHIDDAHVRLAAATVDRPFARIFRIS